MTTPNELILDMLDFGCPSCAYTIEKLGRKIPGVQQIRVDLAEHSIRVHHDGSPEPIARQLTDLVNRIGHDVRERHPCKGRHESQEACPHCAPSIAKKDMGSHRDIL